MAFEKYVFISKIVIKEVINNLYMVLIRKSETIQGGGDGSEIISRFYHYKKSFATLRLVHKNNFQILSLKESFRCTVFHSQPGPNFCFKMICLFPIVDLIYNQFDPLYSTENFDLKTPST
jgi:hypothetical protein